MEAELSLCMLKPGEAARVKTLRSEGFIRRRLIDVGLIEDTKVTCVGKSPMGDPAAYLIRGAVIAIRAADGRNIIVERVQQEEWHGQ